MERHPSALACWGGRGREYKRGRKGREGRRRWGEGGKRKEGRKRRRGVEEYSGTLEDSSELQLSQAPPPPTVGLGIGAEDEMCCVMEYKKNLNAPERKVVGEQKVCRTVVTP